ncbi:uncharacterized protein LOC144167880 [Haemaphysalis longicornis]
MTPHTLRPATTARPLINIIIVIKTKRERNSARPVHVPRSVRRRPHRSSWLPHRKSPCSRHPRAIKGEMQPADLQVLNTGASLLGDAGIPPATLQEEVIDAQAAGSAGDRDSVSPLCTPIDEPHRRQGHVLGPPTRQELSSTVKAAGGPGPNTGNAAGTSQCIDRSGHADGAGDGTSAGAAVGWSAHGRDTDEGVSHFGRPSNAWDSDNEKQRMRSGRMEKG